MTPEQLWSFLPVGFLATITIETCVLMFALSARHSVLTRVVCGVGLTAFTYPIVVLVLPIFLNGSLYVWVAEVFAPAGECVLFWLAVLQRPGDEQVDEVSEEPTAVVFSKDNRRDFCAIIVANLCSFLIGVAYFAVVRS